MKNADKAFPSFDVEINGETLTINGGYGTLIQFERVTGKSPVVLTNVHELLSPSNVVAFLHAALFRKDKKFTQKYIEEHLDQALFEHCINTVVPKIVNAAYDFTSRAGASEDDDAEKK